MAAAKKQKKPTMREQITSLEADKKRLTNMVAKLRVDNKKLIKRMDELVRKVKALNEEHKPNTTVTDLVRKLGNAEALNEELKLNIDKLLTQSRDVDKGARSALSELHDCQKDKWQACQVIGELTLENRKLKTRLSSQPVKCNNDVRYAQGR